MGFFFFFCALFGTVGDELDVGEEEILPHVTAVDALLQQLDRVWDAALHDLSLIDYRSAAYYEGIGYLSQEACDGVNRVEVLRVGPARANEKHYVLEYLGHVYEGTFVEERAGLLQWLEHSVVILRFKSTLLDIIS
jgi:hypothetical protein